jgi:hypothetical protein
MQAMPAWALTLVYFLHLSATVVWLGSLVGLSILVKHGLVITMAVASGFMSWWVMPAIRRAKIRYQRTGDEKELFKLRKRERFLLRVNLLLAALVLLATAAARAS